MGEQSAPAVDGGHDVIRLERRGVLGQSCWGVHTNGFLIRPDPVSDLTDQALPIRQDDAVVMEQIGRALPGLLASRELASAVNDMPIVDLSGWDALEDARPAERAFQIYSHVANALIHGTTVPGVSGETGPPAIRLPAAVAVPLATLGRLLDRPPVLAYASTALTNWMRVDPSGPVEVDNLRVIQQLVGDPDEAAFHLVHVQIESEAASALRYLTAAGAALDRREPREAVVALSLVAVAITRMSQVFSEITKRCSSDVFFRTLRPLLFGFTNVVFEGVSAADHPSAVLRGQSAAQSSAVPAIQRHLGLRHSRHELAEVQEEMLAHMPLPHRQHLQRIDTDLIRQGVIASGLQVLREAYNGCVEALADFRSLHLGIAHLYVASKVADPTGTAGTEFMPWLRGLRDETRQHLLTGDVAVSVGGEVEVSISDASKDGADVVLHERQPSPDPA